MHILPAIPYPFYTSVFHSSFEGPNVEVGQVIAGTTFTSILTPDMASKMYQKWIMASKMDNPMPCLASFFDAISGVKKLPNFVPVINCTTSANEPSFIEKWRFCLNFV